MTPERRGKSGLLGVIAYVAVPGERRRQAGAHFRRAGFETLKGFVALARPEPRGVAAREPQRERIEVE